MDEFPSGQRGQTVNLLLFSFGGPNPPSSTKTGKFQTKLAGFLVSRKPPARQVVQKKPVGDDVEIKTPFVVK